MLQALQETETARTSYRNALARRAELAYANCEAGTAARITRARQRERGISSLELLDTERTAADAQATLALADAQITEAQIDLFRSL